MNCGTRSMGGHGSQLPFHFILVLGNRLQSILSISIESRAQITKNFAKCVSQGMQAAPAVGPDLAMSTWDQVCDKRQSTQHE